MATPTSIAPLAVDEHFDEIPELCAVYQSQNDSFLLLPLGLVRHCGYGHVRSQFTRRDHYYARRPAQRIILSKCGSTPNRIVHR